MDYPALKLLHQSAVVLSVTGFVVRAGASFTGAAWVGGRLARTVPHAVDTVLLVSGLNLAWTLSLTPGQVPWLGAKLAGLVLYVLLGVVALRPGRPLALRLAAWLAALATVGWIASVAITKQPLGYFGVLARLVA